MKGKHKDLQAESHHVWAVGQATSISGVHEILMECTYMEKSASLRSLTEPWQGLQVVSHWML
jgi:hypothetical protein